ncbi:carotenoid oxygenase family protein [Streptomyces sp. NPDC046862]|uniref:carotenoid oxygenase family protein n=1 Tax=Streptomyces sp. NPDC046862 TaxID=3154603 RepID=UPI0034512A18
MSTDYSALSAAEIDEEERRIDAALDLVNYNRDSVYNVPGYRPVRQELTHAPVRVSGELPVDLEGVYLRNGTNVQFDDSHVRLHAFSGAGMIHQIQITGGAATYSNTYVRTPRFEAERAAGREIYPDFSDMTSGKSGLDRILLTEEKIRRGLIPNLDNYERTPGSTSIRYHHGRLYCLQETGYAFVLDARVEDGRLVLDGSGNHETWSGEWEGPFSAHPRVNPDNGDVYNISVEPSGQIIAGLISKGELAAQAAVHQQTEETGGEMGWLHDFFLTEHYMVFPDSSVRRDAKGLAGPEGSVFRYDRDYRMRWGVIPREFGPDTGVRWFTTEQIGMVWHVINAWERTAGDGSTEIVLYSPAFPSYPSSVPIHTPEEPPAQVRTWVLNLDSGETTDDRLLIDHGYERPSLNLGYVGRPSRYCYLLDEHGDGYMGKGVLKYDLIDEKEVAYLDYGDMYGGEALFVRKPSATSEDDGYLVDLLMDDHRAELIVIDAKDMQELARLHLPQRVPFGVHATWLEPDEIATLAG